MNTKEIATRLVALCREGKNIDAINELYDDNIISVEPKGSMAERTEGKKAVMGKTEQWFAMVEQVHSEVISDPLVIANHFAVSMDVDVTLKGFGRNPMREIGVYEVKDGKIVFEQFFYTVTK